VLDKVIRYSTKSLIDKKKNPTMDFILVCLGYYNKNTMWWLINNRNLYLTILEAEKSKIKALADSVSGESTSWFI